MGKLITMYPPKIYDNNGDEYTRVEIEKGSGEFVYLDRFGEPPNPYDLSKWGGINHKRTK